MATTTLRQALRKHAVNVSGAVIIIPGMFVGVFYFLGWMEDTYASQADVKIIQSQQTEQGFKFDTWVYKQEQNQLEVKIEETGDVIFDLKRRILQNATEADERQLDRLERRLERYQDRLDNLGAPPSRLPPPE